LIAKASMAAGLAGSHQECLAVYTKGADVMPVAVLAVAEQITASIFNEIGVAVHWSGESQKQLKGRCIEIDMQFDKGSAPNSSADAIGYALPFGEGRLQVHILIGRILRSSDACSDNPTRMREGAFLGHVMAHEIGHVSQRISLHSDEGVMKAKWTAEEVQGMIERRLSFTKSDAHLIRLGISSRRGVAPRESKPAGQAPDKR
jgi:hypothetical protein